jgi:dienelactone hydrolase
MKTSNARKMLKTLLILFAFFWSSAWAQSDCIPSSAENTKVVDRGPVKTVVGPLAQFDPCHKSVRLDTPSFFAPKRGAKPPLVIIAHGGGGLGGYERDFAKLMNQHGYATLMFDAFEMNGLAPGSDLLLYFMSNGGRQRMIFKATLGAYRWALKSEKVDTDKIFIQGLSNGAAVAINMAGVVDGAHVRGVIAEGGPSAGIGFPNDIKVPVLLLYGTADNYGGLRQDDWMHMRAMPCGFNDHYPLAPEGFALTCNRSSNSTSPMPSPLSWYETIRTKDQDVRLELIDGGGHGMMFADFSSSSRQLSGGRMFYRSHGATADSRQKLQKLVLDFLASKL